MVPGEATPRHEWHLRSAFLYAWLLPGPCLAVPRTAQKAPSLMLTASPPTFSLASRQEIRNEALISVRKMMTRKPTKVGTELPVMAHEEGWPLGLGALNVRAGVMRGVEISGSASFSTDFTSSRCTSSLPSTDFDTESAWSLSRGGGGMTLASLIGLVDAMESRRRPSARASRSGKLRALLLSLCLRSHLENGGRSAPSLGQFLEMERRASGAAGHVDGL
ncbi:hypothetical protein EJB05_18707, partial [Eragrostis curvula]